MKTMKNALTACLGFAVLSTPIAQAYPDWIKVEPLKGEMILKKNPLNLVYRMKFKVTNKSSFYAVTHLTKQAFSLEATFITSYSRDTRSKTQRYKDQYREIMPKQSRIETCEISLTKLFKGTKYNDWLHDITSKYSSHKMKFRNVNYTFDVKTVRVK